MTIPAWKRPALPKWKPSTDRMPSTRVIALISLTTVMARYQTTTPAYWTGTTHVNWSTNPGATGVYINFGRSMGYMRDSWVDVHGAGAQRSDPKAGDPADYPTGHGPQGDAIRIYNHVRLVRN